MLQNVWWKHANWKSRSTCWASTLNDTFSLYLSLNTEGDTVVQNTRSNTHVKIAHKLNYGAMLSVLSLWLCQTDDRCLLVWLSPASRQCLSSIFNILLLYIRGWHLAACIWLDWESKCSPAWIKDTVWCLVTSHPTGSSSNKAAAAAHQDPHHADDWSCSRVVRSDSDYTILSSDRMVTVSDLAITQS